MSALLRGRAGQRVTGAGVLSADELEGCEIGENEGPSCKNAGTCIGQIAILLPHAQTRPA
ncbi:MAG: hypothetical protein JO342_01075 [Solirubrobacterales bacterium]|nr:hypothetical protein [Solirubrobacterales bacterium]